MKQSMNPTLLTRQLEETGLDHATAHAMAWLLWEGRAWEAAAVLRAALR